MSAMAPHRYTKENAKHLAACEAFCLLSVTRTHGRAEASRLEIESPNGVRRPLQPDRSWTPFDIDRLVGRRVVVTQASRAHAPDFLYLRGHSIPLVVSERVLETLRANAVGTFITTEVAIEHDGDRPPKKAWPRYFLLIPAPAGSIAEPIHDASHLFYTSRGIPPPLVAGETDISAVPHRTGIGHLVHVSRALVVIGLQERWTGVAYLCAGLPNNYSTIEDGVIIGKDGEIRWRPPMPTELSITEWLDYAINHTDDSPGTVRRAVRFALIHHADTFIDAATDRLRSETEPCSRRVLAAIIDWASREHKIGRIDRPPSAPALELAKRTLDELRG